jgi:hypothetical protein
MNSSSFGVEMENVLKINAGIACADRANEVEPRPNGETNYFHPSCIFIIHCSLFIAYVNY